MEQKHFQEAITKLEPYKKKFTQTYELIINLRELDLKKPENHIEAWVKLPSGLGKEIKICAIVGPELAEQAKESCNTVITPDDFPKYVGDKKAIKKLAEKHDYFIAQANIMADIAKNFGRVLGPRGKMPNPKAGCVVPPNANLNTLSENLRRTVRIAAKAQPSIKTAIGSEAMKPEDVAANCMAVYTTVARKLPNEQNNIKSVMIKKTMSPPALVSEKGAEVLK